MKIQEFNLGNDVVCDVCGKDWTNRTESGGFVFGSYGYCPECAVRGERKIRESGEEGYIRARCPEGVSFAEFIRTYRGGDGIMQIITRE